MKVGVYLNFKPPESGGGYTYERMLIDLIRSYKSHVDHEFVFIIDGNPGKYDLGDAKCLYLCSEAESWIQYFKRIWSYKKNKYRIDFFNFKENARIKIVKILAKEKIEFLLYLKQEESLTLDIPYITIVWDLQHKITPYFPEVSSHWQWQNRENRLNVILQRATFIVTGTNAGKKQIVKLYRILPDKIIVNPLPVPVLPSDFNVVESDSILKKHSISKQYLFYPAQLWPHKNHVTVLKVVKILEERHKIDIEVVFTGSDKGNGKHVIEFAKSLGIMHKIKYLGFIDRKELAILYKNALALTFVSFFGPDNLPPLEALSLGCPVIAAKVEGAEEYLGNAAIFVDPLDVEDIAQQIVLLATDVEIRKSLITRGYERVRQLSGDSYVGNIISALDKFAPIRETWSSNETYDTNLIRK